MAYLFGIVFAVFALLLSNEAYAHTYQAASDFNNVVSGLCWSYGGFYIGIAGVKFFKTLRDRAKTVENLPSANGAIFFILSGVYLLVFPFIQQALQGMKVEQQGPYRDVFIPVLVVTICAAPFCPWLMLIFSKKLRHLRHQGIKGLCWMPVVPIAVAVVTFLYFKVLFPVWMTIILD